MKPLPVLNSKAAGIDVGSETMHVSIAGDTPVTFGTVTSQLHALRDWLVAGEVYSAALEATGIYWLCLYEVLEAAGIKVFVVNGRHVQNLPGRKTDMSDAQWLATLHAHGLLRSGFVPSAEIRRLQDYQRLRQEHITMAASHVQHMQKALERMNLKIHDVISSLTGVSGMKLIRAILAGERDSQRLLELCATQIRQKKSERLKEALRGNWRKEHLFALGQALACWDFYQERIRECDGEIEQVLQSMCQAVPEPPASDDTGEGSPPAPRLTVISRARPGGQNAPTIPGMHEMLLRVCGGKDTTALPGITDYTLLQLIGEVGTDLTLFPTAKHFTSWLGLAPGSKQSGKRHGRAKMHCNRAGRLFRIIARSVGRSVNMALGGFYRKVRARRGGLVANQALARKIAELFWRVMVHGLEYVEAGLQEYEAKAKLTEYQTLRRLARKNGFQLQSIAATSGQVHG